MINVKDKVNKIKSELTEMYGEENVKYQTEKDNDDVAFDIVNRVYRFIIDTGRGECILTITYEYLRDREMGEISRIILKTGYMGKLLESETPPKEIRFTTNGIKKIE
ncbi:MAG: hypothetical protein JW881_14020 [Spirochaetales bacterium]|nr:hypothetical protein [Spirochaetales bacterium]